MSGGEMKSGRTDVVVLGSWFGVRQSSKISDNKLSWGDWKLCKTMWDLLTTLQ